MTTPSRAAQFAKLYKVLKKYYKPVPVNTNRTVIEQLLFAGCLEDAHFEEAEGAFAALTHTFFDWNEVRVTSISELSEVMACLPDPRAAANRVKRVLHSIFAATFNFDLENLRKKSLGAATEWLEKLDGTTRFSVAYVVQTALGGHAIPLDSGSLEVLRILNLISGEDASKGTAPGLERAISKSKGILFFTLLHEFAADFSANPYHSRLREVFLQIDPECSGRLPKRRVERPRTKPQPPSAPPQAQATVEAPSAAVEQKQPEKKKPSQKTPSEAPPAAPGKQRKRKTSTSTTQRKPR